MAALDWSQCCAVESVPDRLGGAWVFRNTRMPVSAVFENLAAGASIDEIVEQFALTRVQIAAVLEFAARSLDRRLYGVRDEHLKAHHANAVLAQKKRAAELASLSAHQLAALRAVESGAPEALTVVNSFTLDVLGSMGLLSRGKGRRRKTAWRLTDDGRLALERADRRTP